MKTQLLFAAVFAGLFLGACSNKFQPEKHSLASFKLLSKDEAAQAVVTDKHEGFFEKVMPLEMAIQMGSDYSKDNKRDSVLAVYKKFLQDDVQEFLSKEADLLKKTMQKALDLCAQLNPKLPLPAEIQLIKARSSNYGPSVFYTRDNCIIVPANMVADGAKDEELLRVLVHEIFHLYSRHNPDKRKALYELLGYRKLDKIELSPFLQERVLYNPDAVDIAYGITLKNGIDSSFTAIPVIYSKFGRVDLGGFFQHLVFQLFEVKEENGVWRVMHPDVGIQPEDAKGFYEKIGRNTSYIIHPEEVAADNFQMLVFTKDEKLKGNVNVTADGKKLLEAIEQIVTK